MLNIPSQLRSRAEPVRVGVVGAGLFGTNLIDQVERVEGMTTAVVADIDTGKAAETLRGAGVPGAEVIEPVARDEVVSYDDVAVETDSFIYHLRRLQEETL